MIEYNRNMVRVLIAVLLIGFGASTGEALDLPGKETVSADFINGRLLKHVRFRFSSSKPCPLEVSLNCALNSGTL